MLPGVLSSSSGGGGTKSTHESCPQPVPAVTSQSPILAEKGAAMPGVLTPPPAAHPAPSITGTAGLSWDADPPCSGPPGGLGFSWEGLGCSGSALAQRPAWLLPS